MLRRLLLLPLLSPLLAVLLVGALNPRPAVSLRLLIWRTPAVSIGAWMAGAAAAGALLSGGASALAIGEAGGALRRQVRRRPASHGQPWPPSQEPCEDAGDAESIRQPRHWREGRPAPQPAATSAAAGPVRAPGEPPPTVAVAFRVLRRGDSSDPATARRQAQRTTPTQDSRAETQPVAVAIEDDWANALQDDW